MDERELEERGIHAAEELRRDDPLWPGQLSVLAALLLYLVLPPKLTIGPNWLLPSAEFVLLAVTRRRDPRRGDPPPPRRRRLALGIVLVVTVANLVALGLLVHYLIAGGHARGADLINGGLVIWWTKRVIVFGLWYWELDGGGPPRRLANPTARAGATSRFPR